MARQFADDFLSLFQFGIQQQEQRKIKEAELAQQNRESGLLEAFRTKKLVQQTETAKIRESGLMNRFYLGELGQQERSEMLEKGRMERANIAETGREERFQKEQKAIESRFQRRESNITKRSEMGKKTTLDISKPYGELKKAFGAAQRLNPEDENYNKSANAILNTIDENIGIISKRTGLGQLASDIAKVMSLGNLKFEDALKRVSDIGGLEKIEGDELENLKSLVEFNAGKKNLEEQRQAKLSE